MLSRIGSLFKRIFLVVVNLYAIEQLGADNSDPSRRIPRYL